MPIPENGFLNPYSLQSQDLQQSIQRGRKYALQYPVESTGLLIPYFPVKYFFENENEDDPLKKFFRNLTLEFTKIKSLDGLMTWLGLHEYPDSSTSDPVYGIPFPNDTRPSYRMGFSLLKKNNATGFTISCAVCHSANLFGKKIIGLNNRFPRSNEFFVLGKMAITAAPTSLFKWLTKSSRDEKNMFQKSKENILSVNAKKPIQLGLDTSLAHVAMSLALREEDAYATKNYWSYTSPREEKLSWVPSDSKPGTWWNVRYKNKWLLDGSVISGNPILTNLLWNEIGRGSDLQELDNWFYNNTDKVQDITNAVFHNEPPQFTDFFSGSIFETSQLKLGQKLFSQMCSKCHGQYLKNWDLPVADNMSFIEQLKTFKVIMPINTKVVDVGTDPYRYKAMESLKSLNHLDISIKNQIAVQVQKGYVPPPLVGIWARWPYFHNNSIPDLCSVLSPYEERPKQYWAGEALNKGSDFDSDCNGYPLGNKTPKVWQQNSEMFYDSSSRGKGNKGHDVGIFIKNGKNTLSDSDKMALIRFLQTL